MFSQPDSDSGLTIEQELILQAVYNQAKHFNRAELIEALIWAWQQLLNARNTYLELAVEIGAVLDEPEELMTILPAGAPVGVTEEEIRSIRVVEFPEDDDEDGLLQGV